MNFAIARTTSSLLVVMVLLGLPMVSGGQPLIGGPPGQMGMGAPGQSGGPQMTDPTQGIKLALQMMKEAAKPLTEKDIARFFQLADDVIKWIDKNQSALAAIEKLPAQERWGKIEALGMPDAVKEESDFFPLAMKIQMAKATSDKVAVDQAKQKLVEFEQRKAMVKGQLAQMPEAQRGLILEMMESTQQSLELFINYPPKSQALYAKHSKRIDVIFARMESLGQTAGTSMAPTPPRPSPAGAPTPLLRTTPSPARSR